MSTTTIIVEVLIIGFFAAIWLLLFCLRFSLIEIGSLRLFLSQAEAWSTPLFFTAVVAFYQLGLLMNMISHKVTKPFSQKSLRDQIIPGKDYEFVRASVFQKGSSELLRDIVLYLSFVRLARSGILNFLLIAVAVLSFGTRSLSIGLVALLASFWSVLLWRAMYRTYYRRMGFAYRVLIENQDHATATESSTAKSSV